MRTIVIIWAVLAALAMACFGLFQNEHLYGHIHSDAQGYYGYLVAYFIEDSFDWNEVIGSYSDTYFEGKAEEFTVNSDYGQVNKYYAGTAILILPFFLLSCWYAAANGFAVDGYSLPFQDGIVWCGLFYAGLGMSFLSRFLESKGIDKWIAVFVSVCCLFATNLLHYTISEPAMSHVYSFALFSMFLFSADRYLKTGTGWSWYLSAIVLAMIILVRPVNGLIIFSVPFIAGGFGPVVQRIKETGFFRWIIAAVVFVVILSIQSYMYYQQVGKLFVWSYKDEGFNFLDPEVISVLFSYKKGFFIYTPIAFLGLIGVLLAIRKRRQEAAWLLAFLTISVYVIASWWNWYYGSSFGMRALIEFLPFFAFGLALLIQAAARWPWTKYITLTACLFFVSVNLVQSYQYQKFIMHWDAMTKDRFWQIYLVTDSKYKGVFYRGDLGWPQQEEIISHQRFETDFESDSGWGAQGLNEERAASGTHSTMVTEEKPYGSTLVVPVSELGPDGTKRLVITAKVWSTSVFPNLSVACSFRNDSLDYGHQYISIGQYVTGRNQWVEITHAVNLGAAADTADRWVVYPFLDTDTEPYNGDLKPREVYLDDIKYEVLTLRDSVNPASEQP